MAAATPGPPAIPRPGSPPRIVGYDLARALAVFGMVLVNFKIVMGATEAGAPGLVALAGLVDGRAAALFVVSAGAGISLLSRGAGDHPDWKALERHRRTLLRRALFLFVVGLSYTPIWPADILHFYGVYIAVAAVLLGASSRSLLVGAAGLVAAFAAAFFVLPYDRGWDWATLEYSGFWTAPRMIRHLFFNGFHPVVPWLAFLLLGMVIGRLDMLDAVVRRRVFVVGATFALIAEAVSGILVAWWSRGLGPEGVELVVAVFGTEPMPPLPLYMLAGAGTAAAVIAACIGLAVRFPDAPWLRPLVSTGQLALTLYVAHVIIGMGTLEALGRLENQSLPFAIFATVVFCTAAIGFAHLWRKRFTRGPLEPVMRRLTDLPHPAT